MELSFKPIGFAKLKNEINITLKISLDTKIQNLDILLQNENHMVPSNILYMFKGKTLVKDKTLKDYNIVNKSKLMFKESKDSTVNTGNTGTTGTTSNPNPNYNNTKNTNKTALDIKEEIYRIAKQKLILTFPEELVVSVLNTSAESNYTSMDTLDLFIQKSTTFLINMTKKETIELSILTEELENNSNTGNKSNTNTNSISNIYTSGDGTCGQLGVDYYISTEDLLRVNFFSNFDTIKIKSISCGLNHTISLDINGYVYMCGKYFYPKTYNTLTNEYEIKSGDSKSPILMDSLTNEIILNIGTGNNHSFAINDKGNLYTWGEGSYGQLGHGIKDNEFYPRLVEKLKGYRIKSAKGGSMHSVVQTYNGYLFGFGQNDKNQLNFHHVKEVIIPRIIPLYEGIGNYSIEEMYTLKLDKLNFDYTSTESQVKYSEIHKYLINGGNTDNTNTNTTNTSKTTVELSSRLEELSTIKHYSCGNWFTVCTSFSLPNVIYIFGSYIKKTVKVLYFQYNSIEIIEIYSCGNIIVVNTTIGVYFIDFNNSSSFSNPVFISKFKELNLIGNTEDITITNNYMLVKTKMLQVIKIEFKKDESKIISSRIQAKIDSIYSGCNHYFIVSGREGESIESFMYEQISHMGNISNGIDNSGALGFGSTCDMYFKSDFNNNSSSDSDSDKFKSGNTFPLHYDIVNKYIYIQKLKCISNDVYVVNLSKESILLLVELMYTNTLSILYSSTLIQSPESLSNLSFEISSIIKFLESNSDTDNTSNSKNTNLLILLLKSFKEYRIQNMLDFYKYSKDIENNLIIKELLNTCNFINMYNLILDEKNRDNTKNNSNRINPIDNNDDMDNDNDMDEEPEEGEEPDGDVHTMNNNDDDDLLKNYFEKFKKNKNIIEEGVILLVIVAMALLSIIMLLFIKMKNKVF